MMPRTGLMSSESSSMRPTARLAKAAHMEAHTTSRCLVRSMRNSTATMMKAPAPMPPRNRYSAGCQDQVSCSMAYTSPIK